MMAQPAGESETDPLQLEFDSRKAFCGRSRPRASHWMLPFATSRSSWALASRPAAQPSAQACFISEASMPHRQVTPSSDRIAIGHGLGVVRWHIHGPTRVATLADELGSVERQTVAHHFCQVLPDRLGGGNGVAGRHDRLVVAPGPKRRVPVVVGIEVELDRGAGADPPSSRRRRYRRRPRTLLPTPRPTATRVTPASAPNLKLVVRMALKPFSVRMTRRFPTPGADLQAQAARAHAGGGSNPCGRCALSGRPRRRPRPQ